MGESERFGRIEFAIGSDVTNEFKKAVAEVEESDWHPIHRAVNGKKEKTGPSWPEGGKLRLVSSPQRCSAETREENPAVRYWFLKNIPGGLEIVRL